MHHIREASDLMADSSRLLEFIVEDIENLARGMSYVLNDSAKDQINSICDVLQRASAQLNSGAGRLVGGAFSEQSAQHVKIMEGLLQVVSYKE